MVGAVVCNRSLITAKGIPSASIRISLARNTNPAGSERDCAGPIYRDSGREADSRVNRWPAVAVAIGLEDVTPHAARHRSYDSVGRYLADTPAGAIGDVQIPETVERQGSGIDELRTSGRPAIVDSGRIILE